MTSKSRRATRARCSLMLKYLVSYISTLTTLEPGDIILTGSPKLMNGGPAPSVTLKPDDTVRISVGGLGELINPIQEEPK